MFNFSFARIVTTLTLAGLLSLHTTGYGAAPPAPAGLAAVAGNAEISLTWNAVEGATGYVLYRGQASGGPYDYLARTSGTAHRDGSVGNATYHYVVTALNADGQSPYSAQVGTAPDPSVLRAPTGLAATPGNGQVSLAWEAVTSAVSYNVYRATSSGGPYTLLTPAAAGPGFTDRTAVNGSRYYYAVKTLSENAGALSDETDATPSALLPIAPASLTVTPGSTWASLAWTPSQGATGYAVYRGTHTGGPYTFVALSSTTAWEDLSLTNGTVYHYVVAAVNAMGRGAFSEEAVADVNANQRPHAALLIAYPGDGSVNLYWNNPPGAVSFTLHRSDAGGAVQTFPSTNLAAFTDSGLANGTTYYYTLDVHNASGTDAGSNQVAVTPSSRLPAPYGLTLIPGNTEITAKWNPVAGVTGYFLVVAQTPGGDGVRFAWPDGPGVTVTGLTNGETYHVRVQSLGYTGASSFVAEASTTPSTSLPLSPTSVHVEPAGQGGNRQASVSWNAVGGATGYEVYRRTQGGAWPADPVGIATGTSLTEAGLTNETTYCYRVAAVNAAGRGAWSENEVCTVPTAAALPAPTDLAVVAGNTQATLTWTPVVGAANYFITVATSPGGVYALGGNSGSSASFTVGGLTNGVPYHFRVQAVGYAVRTSSYSAEVSATPAAALPLAPANITGASGGNTQAAISWNAVTGATGYRIYRRSGENFWSPIPVGTTAGTLFADSGLENGKSYVYKVAAVNGAGMGAWTEGEVSITPTATALFAPVNLRLIPGNTQATLTWDPVIGATGYYVVASTTAGGAYAAGGGTGSSPNRTVDGLINGQTYHFRVQSTGYLAYASCTSAETNGVPLAALPLAPTGSISFMPGNTQVSLTWNAVPGATSYEIHRRSGSDAWPISAVGTTAGTFFTDSGLSNGTTYLYTVSALNGAGPGAWTYEAGSSPLAGASLAPTNVTAIAGNGQATVSWDPVPGATGSTEYWVAAATSPGGSYVTGGYAYGTTTLTLTSLTNGTIYYFRVQAWNGSQWSAFSTEVSAVPSLPADRGTLFGRISVDFAGNSNLGVANATVSLQGTGYQTTTDSQGNFVLANIPFADYILVVSAPGMETQTRTVTMSDTSQTVTVPQMTVALAPAGIPGDVNGDTVLDISDALYILQVLSGIRPQ